MSLRYVSREEWHDNMERYNLDDLVGGFLEKHPDFWVDSPDKDALTKCVLDFVYELHPNEFTEFMKANWRMILEEYSDIPLQFVSYRWADFVAWADRTKVSSFNILGRVNHRTALQDFHAEIEGMDLFEKYAEAECEKELFA